MQGVLQHRKIPRSYLLELLISFSAKKTEAQTNNKLLVQLPESLIKAEFIRKTEKLSFLSFL